MAGVISVRVSDEEEKAFKNFSKLYGRPVSSLMKEAFIRKIEDEYDMKIIEEYERDVAAGKESLTHWEDVVKELDLDV